jgi:hypothetical protein
LYCQRALPSLKIVLFEDAVGRERRGVGLRIVEVEREEVPRLQILDLGAVLRIART